MSERPDPTDPLADDEPVPQTPEDIGEDGYDDEDEDEPLEDEERPDPTTIV